MNINQLMKANKKLAGLKSFFCQYDEVKDGKVYVINPVTGDPVEIIVPQEKVLEIKNRFINRLDDFKDFVNHLQV